jgi:hypothetical protein
MEYFVKNLYGSNLLLFKSTTKKSRKKRVMKNKGEKEEKLHLFVIVCTFGEMVLIQE